MWGAIKSDLIDFISTIQVDTSKTISSVLGETEQKEDNDKQALEKAISDITRSYTTYSTEIEEQFQLEYQNFFRKFSLSSYSSQIASVLDSEVDVPRFYAELVPAQLRPEDFWARYFFRVSPLTFPGGPGRHAGLTVEGDDEEELTWESGGAMSSNEVDSGQTTRSAGSRTENGTGTNQSTHKGATGDTGLGVSVGQGSIVAQLQDENKRLKASVRALVGRVAELEEALRVAQRQSQGGSCISDTDAGTGATEVVGGEVTYATKSLIVQDESHFNPALASSVNAQKSESVPTEPEIRAAVDPEVSPTSNLSQKTSASTSEPECRSESGSSGGPPGAGGPALLVHHPASRAGAATASDIPASSVSLSHSSRTQGNTQGNTHDSSLPLTVSEEDEEEVWD